MIYPSSATHKLFYNYNYFTTMRRKIFLLFIAAVAALSAAPVKCIIIAPTETESHAAHLIAAALPTESVDVEYVLLSPKGIDFTVDSLRNAVDAGSNAGFIGLGLPQSAAAACCAAAFDASFLVMVSASGFPLRVNIERQLYALTYMPSPKWKEGAGLRKLIPDEIAKSADAEISNVYTKELMNYDPVPVLSQIKCPVLVGEGIYDNSLNWYDNLVAIEAALPENPDDYFVAFPSTGYCLVKADTYAPMLMDMNPNSHPEVNEEAVEIIAGWISDIISSR